MLFEERNYILKLYDTELIKFTAGVTPFGQLYAKISMVNEELRHLFPMPLIPKFTSEALVNWLKSRTIPKNRQFVKEILAQAGLTVGDTLGIIDVCKGLSVNDAFWVDREGTEQSFADVNLYEHELDETLALVAYTGYTSSQHRKLGLSTEWTTDGQFPKAWRKVDGNLYLYKAGSEGFANAGMEPYSEYFACQAAKAMGIFSVSYDLAKWRGKLASVCPLMCSKDISLVPFYAATEQSQFPINLAICSKFSGDTFEQMRSMIVFDALICNVDRHAGNYGFLRDNHTGKILGLAPLFDHNLSLFARDMKDDFKNWPAKADEHLPRTGMLTFKQQCEMIMGEMQHERLRMLLGFQFQNHPIYPIPSDRLDALNQYIHSRTKELLEIPVIDHRRLISMLHQELEQIKSPIPLFFLKNRK
ncbi:hypothetical protein [Hominifimenecus sp. rT4P-3]|uniref:hypothetical protein n=1 Tax=Hominifimenecus sp. rT4P-3 TaxID=3242979 RepID=UPI003DA300AB